MSRPTLRACAAGLLAFLLGCGPSGPKLHEISGQVTYAGRPVKAGIIRFEPAGETMDPRTAPETFIRDGRYELPREKGVAGGSYKVYINAFDGIPGPESPHGTPLFRSTYAVKVDLPTEPTTKNIDIPSQKQ